MPIVLALRRRGQPDGCKFKATLVCIVSSMPVWNLLQCPVSQDTPHMPPQKGVFKNIGLK